MQIDDPHATDVSELLATHLAYTAAASPAEFSFALGVHQLAEPHITLFSAREDGHLVGVAALKRLDPSHAELKSMHTRASDRRRGVGRALLTHILGFAAAHGYRRISLETGTTSEFAAARTLYRSAGFTTCEAFAGYRPSVYNTFMTTTLGAGTAGTDDSVDEPSSARQEPATTMETRHD